MTTSELFQNIPVQRSPRRRRIAVSVAPDGEVVIHAPSFATTGQIALAWSKLGAWAARKQTLLARHPEARPHSFRFAPGGTFFYLGRELPLVLRPAPPGALTIRPGENELLTASADPEAIAQGMEAFYRRQTRRIVTAQVECFAPRFGIGVRSISVNGARRRFGSCNAAGDLNFSWRLAMYPEQLIELVVLHELTHRLHLDHSPAFYAALAQFLPDHRERERELRLWSRKLSAYK